MDVEAAFESDVLADGDLLFRELIAREELGRLPEYELKLLRESEGKSPLAAKKLLGQEARVLIKIDNSTTRYIHGIVTHFERGGATGSHDIYRVQLRPWLWQLTLGADCRVFQDKSVIEVLDEIFAEYKSAGSVDKKLSGSYAKRPYIVQYRESDFDFVSRLMDEEGLYYYFKHTKTSHKLVLCDGPNGHDPSVPKTLDWFDKQKRGAQRDNVITQWSRAHTLQSLAYAHTDYAAEAPATSLFATAKRSPAPSYPAPNDLEVFDYPGGHDDLAMTGVGSKVQTGKDLAQIEVERFESQHCVATALTGCRSLLIGSVFNYDSHDDKGDYLLTSAIATMEYAGYEANFDQRSVSYQCRFNAVPSKIRFRPERRSERPHVRGPQTATVVGPKGDEIHTDKYGRVKLQFHWDRVGKRDEKSSCWVRVAHPWAGKGFGMVALPRIGDEVVVEFLEGNPDRPLVTGRVYNGTNQHPWELPAHATVSGIRTRSTKQGGADNFNELRFEDDKGKEYVWFQAEKDYHQLVKNDAFSTVKNDLWTEVVKNTQHKVGENYTSSVGKVATVDVKGDTHVKLGADLNTAVTGALGLKVTSKIAIKGEQAIALSSGASLDIKAGAGANISAASFLNQKAIKVVIEAGLELCIKAGSSFITLNATGVTIQGPMVQINCGGAAGSAKEAAEAAPTAPKVPGEQKANEDPLAGGGGGK